MLAFLAGLMGAAVIGSLVIDAADVPDDDVEDDTADEGNAAEGGAAEASPLSVAADALPLIEATAGNDVLAGTDAAERIAAGADDDGAAGTGSDPVDATAGRDRLWGRTGDAALDGEDEDHDNILRTYLDGMAGGDVLTPQPDDWGMGGDDADLFGLAPNPAGPAPTIGDFDPASDRLVLTYAADAGPAPVISVAPDPADQGNAIVFADGRALAVVLDCGSLTPDMIELCPFGEVAAAA